MLHGSPHELTPGALDLSTRDGSIPPRAWTRPIGPRVDFPMDRFHVTAMGEVRSGREGNVTSQFRGRAIAAAAFIVGISIGTSHAQLRPIVFVHGATGSGAQYESQAMRFASNGYPADYIRVHE